MNKATFEYCDALNPIYTALLTAEVNYYTNTTHISIVRLRLINIIKV